jgi:hypothetical protein
MAIIGKGPGPKKKNQPKSKVGGGVGRTVAAPGYAMGLIRNEKAIKEPTKKYTTGKGPASASFTAQQGIIGPKPVTPAKKAPKRGYNLATGAPRKSAVGQALSDAKNSISYAVGQVGYNLRPSVQKRATFKGNKGGRRGGGKTCPAY